MEFIGVRAVIQRLVRPAKALPDNSVWFVSDVF